MLNEAQREALIAAAQEAQKTSYSIYSHYAVGAAVLTVNGNTYVGSNIENAVYPLSICAERVAAFKAVSAEDCEFVAIAVVTRDAGTPCGSCRQVLSEFGPHAEVFIADENGKLHDSTTIDKLLPGAFGPSNLKTV